MESQIAVLVVVTPLIVSFFIPVLGWLNRKFAFPLALAAIACSLAASLAIAYRVVENGPISYFLGGWDPPWGIEYCFDYLNAFMVVLVSFVALVVVIYSKQSVTAEQPGQEVPFYCIFLLLFTGLIGMVATRDMFNLYVFLEISSLTGYALIAIGGSKAAFSAFKYVVIGTIGACFYLLGVGNLYAVTGSLNMNDLAERLPDLYGSRVVLVAFIFFVVGLGIKMGLFPLHSWLPGAYTNAPSAVSTYIAPLMTKVAAYALIRVMFTVFEPEFSVDVLPVQEVLGWIAAIAIVYGSALAIAQNDLKRMLAFSSISQIGYIVLGITLGNHQGFVGSLLHILNHAFMKGCLFAVAGAIIYRLGTRKIEDFAFLHRKMPYTAAAFAIAAFSMIGLPPTAGFFSKWYLILGTVMAEKWIFLGVILLSSLLNAVYFFRVIEHIYLKPKRELRAEEQDPHALARNEAPRTMLIPVLVLAVGILILGLASSWIIDTLLGKAVPAGIL